MSKRDDIAREAIKELRPEFDAERFLSGDLNKGYNMKCSHLYLNGYDFYNFADLIIKRERDLLKEIKAANIPNCMTSANTTGEMLFAIDQKLKELG